MTKTKAKTAQKSTPGIARTIGELAVAAGVSTRTVSTWKLSRDFPVEPDGTFNIWAVSEWRTLKGIKPAEFDQESLIGEFAGPTSPALEKWRHERYLMAKLDREEREGSLMRRCDVHAFILEASNILRRWGERMARAFGPHGEEMHRDCIEDMEDKTSRMFGPDCERLEELTNQETEKHDEQA